MSLSISDWIGIAGVLATIALGIIALCQNCKYKRQADSFADLQFMPEFFLTNTDGFILNPTKNEIQEVCSCGYGYAYSLGTYLAEKTPIYDLSIKRVLIDDKQIDNGTEAQCTPISVFPTDPRFVIKISIPEEIEWSQERHQGVVYLNYMSAYGIKYSKKIEFIFENQGIGKRIHARNIKQFRAERDRSI